MDQAHPWVDTAIASFLLFNMSKEAQHDIIKTLTPIHDKLIVVSKLNSTKKSQDRFDPFKVFCGSKWNFLIEIRLNKFHAKK